MLLRSAIKMPGWWNGSNDRAVEAISNYSAITAWAGAPCSNGAEAGRI